MTNTITFHLKRDLVFLSSFQNTYHNWLNLAPNRDQQTEQFFWKKLNDDQWIPHSGILSFGQGPQGRRMGTLKFWSDFSVLIPSETDRFWFVDSNLWFRAVMIKISHFSSKIQPGSVLDEQFLEFFLVDVSILLSHLQQTFMVFGTVIAPYQFTKSHSKVIF